MRRYLTLPILLAVVVATTTIVAHPTDAESYSIAAAAIIGAVSRGKKPHPKQDSGQ